MKIVTIFSSFYFAGKPVAFEFSDQQSNEKGLSQTTEVTIFRYSQEKIRNRKTVRSYYPTYMSFMPFTSKYWLENILDNACNLEESMHLVD